MTTPDDRILAVLRQTVLSHIDESEWQGIEKAVVDAGGIRQVEGYARTVVHGAIEKAKSFGGDRSQAGRYAANVRWAMQQAGDDAKRRAAGQNAAAARFRRDEAPRAAAAGGDPPVPPSTLKKVKKTAEKVLAAYSSKDAIAADHFFTRAKEHAGMGHADRAAEAKSKAMERLTVLERAMKTVADGLAELERMRPRLGAHEVTKVVDKAIAKAKKDLEQHRAVVRAAAKSGVLTKQELGKFRADARWKSKES
jgi:hypothetical protein